MVKVKTFKLAFANIRKSKSNTIILLLMFLIAGFLLNAGLLVLINFTGFYDEISADLNTSDVYYAIPTTFFSSEVEDFFETNDNFLETEVRQGIWFSGDVQYNDEIREDNILFMNADQDKYFSRWQTIGDSLDRGQYQMPAYIPLAYKLVGGHELGGTFEIEFEDIFLEFTIVGFTQDVYFNVRNTGLMGIYLPQHVFETVSEMFEPAHDVTIIFANLEELDARIMGEIIEIANLGEMITGWENMRFSIDRELIRTARTMMAEMMSVMIVLFSIIVMSVCLIVVRFRIKNSVEEDLSKIGSLKAVGYTTRQIILSIAVRI